MEKTEDAKLNGLGGWLVLLAILLIGSPIGMAYELIINTLAFFREGNSITAVTVVLTTLPIDWALLIAIEMVGNIFFIIFYTILIPEFFRKSHLLPGRLIILLTLNAIFLAGELIVIGFLGLIYAIPDLDVEGGIRAFGFAVARAAVWIPYLLVSIRVKNTFVRKESDDQLKSAGEGAC